MATSNLVFEFKPHRDCVTEFIEELEERYRGRALTIKVVNTGATFHSTECMDKQAQWQRESNE